MISLQANFEATTVAPRVDGDFTSHLISSQNYHLLSLRNPTGYVWRASSEIPHRRARTLTHIELGVGVDVLI